MDLLEMLKEAGFIDKKTVDALSSGSLCPLFEGWKPQLKEGKPVIVSSEFKSPSDGSKRKIKAVKLQNGNPLVIDKESDWLDVGYLEEKACYWLSIPINSGSSKTPCMIFVVQLDDGYYIVKFSASRKKGTQNLELDYYSNEQIVWYCNHTDVKMNIMTTLDFKNMGIVPVAQLKWTGGLKDLDDKNGAQRAVYLFDAARLSASKKGFVDGIMEEINYRTRQTQSR